MENWFRIGAFVGGMAAIFGAFWLGTLGQTGSATAMAITGILLIVFAHLQRFKRFEGLGFKGELWEREMEQAAELRRQLTELAEQLGESVVWQMTPRLSLPGDQLFQRRSAIVQRTTEILTRIGVSPQRISELKNPWHKFVMLELARPIVRKFTGVSSRRMRSIQETLNAEREKRIAENQANEAAREVELEAELQAMQEYKDQDDAIWRDDYENVPSLIRRAIERAPGLSMKIAELSMTTVPRRS